MSLPGSELCERGTLAILGLLSLLRRLEARGRDDVPMTSGEIDFGPWSWQKMARLWGEGAGHGIPRIPTYLH